MKGSIQIINLPLLVSSLGCPSEWSGYMLADSDSAKCYFMSDSFLNWGDANKKCAEMGTAAGGTGTLASIADQHHQEFVFSLMYKVKGY